MKFYFYILHLLQPNVVSLQVPMYIEATDSKDALSKAAIIKALAIIQFQLLFDPSDPVLFVQLINGPSFGVFFTALGNGNRVTLSMPANFNINLYQYNHHSLLSSLDALVLVGGSHANVYSL